MLKETKHKGNEIVINGKQFASIVGTRKIRYTNGIYKGDTITFNASSELRTCRCPHCDYLSKSVHSSYVRTLLDLPLHGIHVLIKFRTRRFRCYNKQCSHKIFSEQRHDLTTKYSRRSNALTEYLKKFLVETSSNKGAYLCNLSGIPQSPSTCLRIVNGMETDICVENIKRIGIDDFAFRKGISYGTIIVDHDTGRPIQLVTGRAKEDVLPYIKRFKNLQIVSRDRASAYSSAVKEVNPDAIQVADRFHLIKNCGDHILEQIKKNHKEVCKVIKEINGDSVDNPDDLISIAAVPITKLVGEPSQKKKELFNEVKRLYNKRISIRRIAEKLDIDRKTVKKYIQLEEAPGRLKTHKINLNSHIGFIEDCIKNRLALTMIHNELNNRGLKCSYKSLLLWVSKTFPNYDSQKRRRKVINSPEVNESIMKSSRKAISISNLAIHVCNPEWGIDKETGECSNEYLFAEKIINKMKMLLDLREAYTSFLSLIKNKNPIELDAWITKWKSESYSRLRTFAHGMETDIEAVRNAIQFDYSNGIVEGFNNKLKSLKRGMYGRCSDKLLKIKLLHSITG